MAIEASDIQPISGAAPAPAAPTPEEASPGTPSDGSQPVDGHGIPDALLSIPQFGELLKGKPAAFSVEQGVKTPETELVVANANALQEAGFGFYVSLDNKHGVLFNTQFLKPEELKKADKAGKLLSIAPPLEGTTGMPQDASAAGAAPPSPAPAPVAAPAVPATPTNPAVTRARLQNLTPGAPTSGPVPGQGRILNSLLKPVV